MSRNIPSQAILVAALTSTGLTVSADNSPEYSIVPQEVVAYSEDLDFESTKFDRPDRIKINRLLLKSSTTEVADTNSDSKSVIDIFRKILSSPEVSITTSQKKVTLKILIYLMKKIESSMFSVMNTNENEVQIYRESNGFNYYLIIDEYGGIALNIIGAPGKGYSSQYIDDNEINQRKIIEIVYDFTRS